MLSSIDYVAPPGAFWPNLRMYLTPTDPFDPLQIRNVTGLEPVAAEVNSRGYGIVDGEFYVGSHVGKRNIVITLGLNPIGGEDTVNGARDILYRYFLPKNAVKLQLNFTNRDPVQIEGYVESITGDRFQQNPEMQLSIVCPKPNFEAIAPTVITGTTGTPTPTEVDTQYIGDNGAGIIFEMTATGSVFSGNLEIRKRVASNTGYSIMSFFNLYIPQNWKLVIDTRQGKKKVVANPPSGNSSEPINQFAQMNDVTYWHMLFAAINHLSVKATAGRTWTITYTNQFVGV